MTMTTLSALLAALAASSASAFTNVKSAGPKTVHEPSSLRNALRDLSGMPSEGEMMGQYADFSRSPRGSDAGYSRQRHGYDHSSRGFDPFSAYGGRYAMSQRSGGPGGEYFPDMMPLDRMNGGMNGVRNDNTMGGFSYDSRVSGRFNDQFGPPAGPHGGPGPGRDHMGQMPPQYPGQMQQMGGGYGGQFGPGGGEMMYDQYGPPELMGMYGGEGYGPMMDGGFMDGDGGDMQQDMGRLGP